MSAWSFRRPKFLVAEMEDGSQVVAEWLRPTWERARTPRRHWRREGTFRTMCGLWTKDVVIAKPGAKYPLERANCKRCQNAEMAALANAFQSSMKLLDAGAITTEEAEERFHKVGHRLAHPSRAKE